MLLFLLRIDLLISADRHVLLQNISTVEVLHTFRDHIAVFFEGKVPFVKQVPSRTDLQKSKRKTPLFNRPSFEFAKIHVDTLNVSTYKLCMTKNTNRNDDLASEIGKRGTFASLQQETCLNLMRTHEQLSGKFVQLFKSLGLSAPQYNALGILRGENKPLQIYEIAERMISPQTDISRLIDRLVKTKMVSRDRCREDRRVVWIGLLPKGKAILKKLDKPLNKLHRSQFGNLSERELATLNRLLFRARGPQAN